MRIPRSLGTRRPMITTWRPTVHSRAVDTTGWPSAALSSRSLHCSPSSRASRSGRSMRPPAGRAARTRMSARWPRPRLSTSELAAATTDPARRRAVARAQARLAALPQSSGLRSARQALAAEKRALALPPGRAAERVRQAAGERLAAALARLGASQRSGAATALAELRGTQDRAWKSTLAAFPSGMLLLALLLLLLRMLRRRERAGADAKLADLEKAAVTDPLTGLRNRRTFDDDLERALAKGRVCLVMLDLDGLKQTNERLGHAVGDERIRAVSAAVRAADRTATGYRLGGDEFAAILAGCGADAGHRFAHRVQDAMRVQHGGDDPSVAVGVAVGELRSSGRRPHAPRRHRAAGGQAHDLADPRALPRARPRRARAARRRAQAGRPRRRPGSRRRRQGRGRLRPQPLRGRPRRRHRRDGRPLAGAGRARAHRRAPARRRLPRRRRRDLRQGRAADRRGVGRDRLARRARRAHPRALRLRRDRRLGPPPPRAHRRRRLSRTGSRARPSRSSRASCTSPTPTRR